MCFPEPNISTFGKAERGQTTWRPTPGRHGRVEGGRPGSCLWRSKPSLVPDLLLRSLTAQQAADLLEYLSTPK
jgi:hypothetical protein